ncbi:MAG: VOC family protein [Pseudomonadota bacterium]
MSEKAHPTVTPMLATPDPDAAIAFYEAVFGAKRLPLQLKMQGALVHAEIEIGGTVLMLGAAGGPAPTADPLAGPKLNLMVEDADAVCAKAVAQGAETLIPVAEQFYGHRSGRIRDPFGYVWVLSQVVEDLSPAEIQARLDRMG